MANKKGRSEKKKDWLGRDYVQHYDSKGSKSGRSERKETWLGKKYTQHYDAKGEKRGQSEKKETWLGKKYTQKYDAKGEKSGRSENKETWLGKKYTQHYDSKGNKTDWSENKETWLGGRYRQRYSNDTDSAYSSSRAPSRQPPTAAGGPQPIQYAAHRTSPSTQPTTTHSGNQAAIIILVVLGLIGCAWLASYVSQQGTGTIPSGGGSSPPRQPIDVSSIKAAVMGALDGWVAATKTGNVENCMSFFADRLDSYYSLRNVGSDKVRSDLMKAFSTYSTFDVQLSNVEITPDQNGTTATATFDKFFNFQGPKYYSAKVQQRMWFANQGGKWRITGLKELQIYSKNTGVVADASGGTTDASTASQGTTPQSPSYDPNASRIREEAVAQDYWQRADRLLQQRQYSAALDVCNQGLAAVPGNNALLRKKNEIERELSEVAGNGYGQTPAQQPTLKRRPPDDSQVQIPAPRPTPPVYEGPRQGVITRPVVIEQNELISIGDDLPGVPVMIDVEPRDQVGIAEAPGPSNRWRKLVLRSKKKMHVVITVRWSVLGSQ
jgi:hypothetical protein